MAEHNVSINEWDESQIIYQMMLKEDMMVLSTFQSPHEHAAAAATFAARLLKNGRNTAHIFSSICFRRCW